MGWDWAMDDQSLILAVPSKICLQVVSKNIEKATFVTHFQFFNNSSYSCQIEPFFEPSLNRLQICTFQENVLTI